MNVEVARRSAAEADFAGERAGRLSWGQACDTGGLGAGDSHQALMIRRGYKARGRSAS